MFALPNDTARMDWKTLIAGLRARGLTLDEIRIACGFASRGHVHDVMTGKQGRVMWEIGDAMLRLHRRVMRRKVK